MNALRDKYLRLLKDEAFSDITFIIGQDEERIKAHKGILSVSSQVFHSMFLESEEQDEFRIMDITPSTFKVLLEFIYIDEYPELDLENWAPLLYAAEKYEISSLMNKCIEFSYDNCTIWNACKFFNQASKNQVHSLVPRVKRLTIFNADITLTSYSILEIEDNEFLKEILSSDKLNCDEIVVYESALEWASSKISERGEDETGDNIRKVLGPALFSIRFPRICPIILTKEIIPMGILTDEEILCILKGKKEDSNPFKCVSRIRSCVRFHSTDSVLISSKRHSIQFQVDCSVKIHGIGIYKPFKVATLEGKMFLKDEENAILEEESFEIDYAKTFFISVTDFPNPIIINANTWYSCMIEYDTLNVVVLSGTEGQSELSVDGVKWKFKNDPLSCEQTDEHQGQIPWILFSKID